MHLLDRFLENVVQLTAIRDKWSVILIQRLEVLDMNLFFKEFHGLADTLH